MASSLASISLNATLKATVRNAINTTDLITLVQGDTFTPATALTTGTAANQADRAWESVGRTLNSAATENLDMYDLAAFDIGGGAGKDAAGVAFTNVEIVALRVFNYVASTGVLQVGGLAATTAWNSPFYAAGAVSDDAAIAIMPGGLFMLFAPPNPAYAVADTTNHLLKFLAIGGNCTFDVMFLARSA